MFFPVTLWRTLTRPLEMMEYSDHELKDREDQQYEDTLSPPLFLLLALLLSHGLELATAHTANPLVADHRGLSSLISDDTSLLMLRLAIFSIIPLMLAVSIVVSKKQNLTRQRLRAPFYAQCYPAAPFALLVAICAAMLSAESAALKVAGLTGLIVVSAGYFAVQVAWFHRHLGSTVARAVAGALFGFVSGLAVAIGVALLFSGRS